MHFQKVSLFKMKVYILHCEGKRDVHYFTLAKRKANNKKFQKRNIRGYPKALKNALEQYFSTAK